MLEPFDNGNVTDQPSAKDPGATAGGSIVGRDGWRRSLLSTYIYENAQTKVPRERSKSTMGFL